MNTPIDLAELAPVGGFFALRPAPAPGGAVPLVKVYDPPTDADPLAFRVGKVARRLGAPEERIAVSVAQLGLAARLWSVALGSAALYGAVPDLDPALLSWDADGTSPDDLWLAGTGTLPADAVTVRNVVQHVISRRSPTRCAPGTGSRPGCCGATRAPRSRERAGSARLGGAAGPRGRGGAGARPGLGTLRPP